MKKTIITLIALIFSASVANAEIISSFTSEVQNREPVNNIEQLNKAEIKKIIFYTTIKDMNGQRVFHVWKNGDKQIHKQTIDVAGFRWRVWSSVISDHFQMGDIITAQVQDDKGNIIDSKSIKVVGAVEVPAEKIVEEIQEEIKEVKDESIITQ